MRTRFLTDFFNSSSSVASPSLDFLPFPPPHLPSADHLIFDHISCFDLLSSITVSPELSRLSVNESLSKFLSDVLPQEIDQPIATEEEKIKEDGTANANFTLLEFETPELCTSLEDSCLLHEEKICFEVTAAEFPTDLFDSSIEVQKLMDIHKAIFSVEDIHLEIQEEHKSDSFKDGNSVKGQISSDLRSFPLLEVDEISLGINSYISDDKHMIFETNEVQQWMQKDELTCVSKELLLSMKFDISENLLNHSSLECYKSEVPCVNFDPEYIINAIEQLLSPLAFEQFQFFDINTSHFSQVFSDTETISEVEHCEEMFGNTTLITFNELIVTHELVLTDDSFNSLPVPIISDHETILSVQLIVEEIFVKLKMQPSSISDDIYLNWHLIEEDICSRGKHASLKMFEDIDTYCINADMDADIKSCDSLMVVLEFVLSDACSNEQKTKENTEVLNLEMFGNLMENAVIDGVDSSQICKKMESGEALVGTKVNKSHQLVESISQFDDLDFFLNPLEAAYAKKQKSANNPIETHDISRKQQQSMENEIRSKEVFHSTSIPNESSKNFEESLHSTQIEGKNSIISSEPTNEVPKPRLPMESKKVDTNMPIIVNTLNGETDMIISRRSTYQKILAMEKEGIQVVERDLNLPVDVIISAASCLVLYDINNIRKKTNSLDGASSLPSCVENIAANVLTSLSFSLSSCILIFEGEVGFIGGIMESSDELYAAAASLGIDLQLFYSYSSETTDEIILNCITHAAKSTKVQYHKMPESESLAESFLSKFPSLNPHSALAILSSVETLVDFFEMPHQQRVCALQKYLVPEASIKLFSALCRYGEREDSRSGTTDCCSSVSSGHDSGYCCPKVDHGQKKRKYESPKTKHLPVDHMFQFENINDVLWDPPKTIDSHRFWNSEGDEISDARLMLNQTSLTKTSFGERKKAHMPIDKGEIIDIDGIYFSKNQRSDTRMVLDHPSLTETSFGQRKKVHMPINKGEIIDIDDDAMSSEWFNLPTFSPTVDINSDLDSCIPAKNICESFRQRFIQNSQTDLMNNFTPLSKAISSDQPQNNSPWTIDFLNRMKEKSRMRQQSMPNIPSAPCFGSLGNSAKFRKRKSPSILDFYRYTSGSTVKSMEHKAQKGHLQPPSSSKVVQTAPSLSQTWTPIDKRAKRKLTFVTNGSKGQSKLIWSDKANQTL